MQVKFLFYFGSAANIRLSNFNNAVQNNNGYFILSANSFLFTILHLIEILDSILKL